MHRRPVGKSTVSAKILLLTFALGIGFSALAITLASASSTGLSSTETCQQPQYVTNLAMQVRQDPRFASAGGNLSYTLIYGDNVGATTGVVNATLVKTSSADPRNVTGGGGTLVGGTPYYSPPRTELAFYSYGLTSQPACASNPYPGRTVVSALWVEVPLNANGSYNMANMTIYRTPGLFTNGTAIYG
ncbi:MAG TPA: hypothetical protein VJN71_03290 [Nitrososphaerales archaeon]|nr:hypothetical protein [Nitrososphaerales archaeon]